MKLLKDQIQPKISLERPVEIPQPRPNYRDKKEPDSYDKKEFKKLLSTRDKKEESRLEKKIDSSGEDYEELGVDENIENTSDLIMYLMNLIDSPLDGEVLENLDMDLEKISDLDFVELASSLELKDTEDLDLEDLEGLFEKLNLKPVEKFEDNSFKKLASRGKFKIPKGENKEKDPNKDLVLSLDLDSLSLEDVKNSNLEEDNLEVSEDGNKTNLGRTFKLKDTEEKKPDRIINSEEPKEALGLNLNLKAGNKLEQPMKLNRVDFLDKLDIEESEIVDQVVREVKVQLTSEKSHINIDLKPEALGKVLMDLEFTKGELRAKIFVENPKTKEVLESNLWSLEKELEDTGMEIRTFEVFVGSESDFNRGNQGEHFFNNQGEPSKKRSNKLDRESRIKISSDYEAKTLVPGHVNLITEDRIDLRA